MIVWRGSFDFQELTHSWVGTNGSLHIDDAVSIVGKAEMVDAPRSEAGVDTSLTLA